MAAVRINSNSGIQQGRRASAGLLVFAGLLMSIALVFNLFALSAQAYALDTVRWTAKANNDNKDLVMGGQPTRVTWQGKTAEDEVVSKIDLKLPEGTTVSAEGVSVSVLDGMTHLDMESNVESTDGQTITVEFPEPVPGNAVIMIEANKAVLPAAGGSFQPGGTYTLTDGTIKDIPGFQRDIDVVLVSPSEQIAGWLSEQGWVQAINSNSFLHAFFDPTVIVTSIPIVFQGFLMAIAVVAVAFPLAIPIGLVLALFRMARFRILRFIGSLYVNVVRGTPLFLQIYIAFLGLPFAGIELPQFPLAVAVLSLNSAAYLCEIFRAGIQSISKGQFEAARSLGMSGSQTMLFVIIPQTVRRVLPTMTSEFILLYKDTSLLASVGMMEVVLWAKTTVATTGSLAPYIVAACFYLMITIPMANLVGKLEARLAGNDTGATKKGKKGSLRDATRSLTPGGIGDGFEGSPDAASEELPISPERYSSM